MRAANVKGGAGQALMFGVMTTPVLPTGTVAAAGTPADGPSASWLAGLMTVPSAAAPSVPRLTAVAPASPNVYE